MVRVIDLKAKHEDEVKELERLHYETMAKERIVSSIVANGGSTSNSAFDNFYAAYLTALKAYDQGKQTFYDKCVSEHVTNLNATWEINFTNCELTLRD